MNIISRTFTRHAAAGRTVAGRVTSKRAGKRLTAFGDVAITVTPSSIPKAASKTVTKHNWSPVVGVAYVGTVCASTLGEVLTGMHFGIRAAHEMGGGIIGTGLFMFVGAVGYGAIGWGIGVLSPVIVPFGLLGVAINACDDHHRRNF